MAVHAKSADYRTFLTEHSSQPMARFYTDAHSHGTYQFIKHLQTDNYIEDIKSKLGKDKNYVQIKAEDLFTNFNKEVVTYTTPRHVGAFTHCWYTLKFHGNNKSEKEEFFEMDYFIIVTNLDEYTSDDGYERVANLIKKDNLKKYTDDALPGLVMNASRVNFVFVCSELPELLVCRLAETSSDKLKVPDSTPRSGVLKAMKEAKWQITTVNCGAEVTKIVLDTMRISHPDSAHSRCDIPTFENVKELQTDLQKKLPGWRVCWYQEKEVKKWHFAVPCLIFKKAGPTFCYYLAFYLPFKSNKLPDPQNVDCLKCGDDMQEVSNRYEEEFDELGDNEQHLTLIDIEQILRTSLGFQVSFLLHQKDSVIVRHREAYRSIDVDLEYMSGKLKKVAAKVLEEKKEKSEPILSVLHAICQVIDARKTPKSKEVLVENPDIHEAIKKLLDGIDGNRHLNRKVQIIFCSRNTKAVFQGVESKVVEIGPIKLVVVVS